MKLNEFNPHDLPIVPHTERSTVCRAQAKRFFRLDNKRIANTIIGLDPLLGEQYEFKVVTEHNDHRHIQVWFYTLDHSQDFIYLETPAGVIASEEFSFAPMDRVSAERFNNLDSASQKHVEEFFEQYSSYIESQAMETSCTRATPDFMVFVSGFDDLQVGNLTFKKPKQLSRLASQLQLDENGNLYGLLTETMSSKPYMAHESEAIFLKRFFA